MNKYLIKQSLLDVEFCKVTKDEEKYGKSLVELTDEELQEKIEYYKNQGFQVATYHQEEFGDGWRFIKDGEGLDDIKKMTKLQLNQQLDYCRKEVENICKKEILKGNIELLRAGDYPFVTATRVRDIIFKYIRQNHRKKITHNDIKDILALFSGIGNIYQTLDVIYDIVDEEVIFLNNMLGDFCRRDIDIDYLYVLLNEIYLEDLLTEMLRKNELTEEEYQKYSCFPHQFDDKENDNYELLYNIVYSCNVNK